jgi:hypothetical protein
VCHGRLHKKLVRVLLRFRLGLGVRDSVGGPVVVVRHRLFNRHLDVPWEILFLLFEWIQPSINQLCFHTDSGQVISTTLRS